MDLLICCLTLFAQYHPKGKSCIREQAVNAGYLHHWPQLWNH